MREKRLRWKWNLSPRGRQVVWCPETWQHVTSHWNRRRKRNRRVARMICFIWSWCTWLMSWPTDLLLHAFYCDVIVWASWGHQQETFSALLALCEGNPPVTGGFPSQRPVTRSFDVFFDLRLDKQLSRQLRRWWFKTPSHSLRRHCNGNLPRQWNFVRAIHR